jgi:hypothetical protein
MKGVNNKPVKSAGVSGGRLGKSRKNQNNAGSTSQRQSRVMTATDLASINRRLDQCLPMETLEWQRVEQLLMQISEFAPNSLVYEAGMAVAPYADDQARRAYLLGIDDGETRAAQAAETAAKTGVRAGDAA